MVMKANLIASFLMALLLAAVLAGCSVPRPDTEDLKPLEFTYVRIGQDQYGGGLGTTYTGSVAFPFCIHNQNEHDLMVEAGYEIYQKNEASTPSDLHMVKQNAVKFKFLAGGGTVPNGLIYHIYINETIEGNSSNYAIHLWHQILNPHPVHRVDRWFNMTFTPYGPSSTTHEEGEPC